jgi:hypothetical protein
VRLKVFGRARRAARAQLGLRARARGRRGAASGDEHVGAGLCEQAQRLLGALAGMPGVSEARSGGDDRVVDQDLGGADPLGVQAEFCPEGAGRAELDGHRVEARQRTLVVLHG